jgi:hypothetical protein
MLYAAQYGNAGTTPLQPQHTQNLMSLMGETQHF